VVQTAALAQPHLAALAALGRGGHKIQMETAAVLHLEQRQVLPLAALAGGHLLGAAVRVAVLLSVLRQQLMVAVAVEPDRATLLHTLAAQALKAWLLLRSSTDV